MEINILFILQVNNKHRNKKFNPIPVVFAKEFAALVSFFLCSFVVFDGSRQMIF